MTSTRGVQLAEEVLENQPEKAEPLLKLLYAFKIARGDPEAEAMMDTVLQFCFGKTDHCYQVIDEFADESKSHSVAA